MNRRWWLLAGGVAAAAGLWWSRALVWLAARQLFLGAMTALAALPVMKRLERRFSGGVSAALSIAALNAVLAAALFWFVPLVIRQARQIFALLPELWNHAESLVAAARQQLMSHGWETAGSDVQSVLITRGQQALGAAAPALMDRLSSAAGNIGQWLLAPVFGFYFLRDRRLISHWLLTLLPVGWRGMAVCILREMRRETAGYLRGQLMISASVGALTAAGLLLCGVPAWLALGAAMGILEIIPYVGPVIGAAAVALFALPQGLWRTVWALGVVAAVQQVDGSVLSPRLISQTTRLHPAVVVLCVVLGGAAAGVTGIFLAVPLVLCIRAALRVAMIHQPQRE